MKFIADFHIHSKYSRATSPDMDIDHIAQWAKIKGIQLMGTGDFTHPFWLADLKKTLKPLENGLFTYKDINFILTAEVSNIYTQAGKTRKVHSVIFAPSFEVVEKINKELRRYGTLSSDGRPMLSNSAKDLVKIVLDASAEAMVVPGHAWTPWFSVFGSKSGFDSLKECFEELTPYVYAIETGLSSDPAMNWRLSQLDKVAIISNSDAHSPSKIGREANVFDCEMDYKTIIETIKKKDPTKFLFTIEFFPEEGKYHYDGHRACNISWSPKETRIHKGICPVCKREVTVGVMNRVEELADREEGFKPKAAIPFKRLVPLEEIIAEAIGKGVGTKAVEDEYNKLIAKFKTEFGLLLDATEEEIKQSVPEKIAEGILKVRQGRIKIEPGYDGVYGKIKIFSEEEKKTKQTELF